MAYKVGDVIIFHNDNGVLNLAYLGKVGVVTHVRGDEFDVKMLDDVPDPNRAGLFYRRAGEEARGISGYKHTRIAHANHISQKEAAIK